MIWYPTATGAERSEPLAPVSSFVVKSRSQTPPYGVNYDPAWRHRAGVNRSGRLGKVHNDERADWEAAWALFAGNIAYVWHRNHARSPN